VTILHVNSLYHPNVIGGAERSVQALAEAQVQRGLTPIVASLSPSRHVRQEFVNGVEVHYLPLQNCYWPFTTKPRPHALKPLWHALDAFNPLMATLVRRLIASRRPALMHTHNLTGFSASVWQVARDARLPVVHTLRDYSLLCPAATMFYTGQNCGAQHLSCALYSLPRMRLSNSISAVTSVSQFTLDRHLAAGAFARVGRREIVPNFVVPAPIERATRAEAGRPFTFGYIGQIVPVKGVDRLIEAFPLRRAGECELLIAGEGDEDYVRSLRDMAKDKQVRFLGRKTPEEFYPFLDMLVVPSLWHEPFARVVIEAYSYGVPVVASNRGGQPEAVEPNVTGFLFDPDRPEALRALLMELVRDGAPAELARNARARAERFSSTNICNRYEAVYRSTIA
jgi:glycosyltransferase involved in cell wall biosynthesis